MYITVLTLTFGLGKLLYQVSNLINTLTFMIGSQSDFFSKPKEILFKSKNKLIAILDLKGYTCDEIALFNRLYPTNKKTGIEVSQPFK